MPPLSEQGSVTQAIIPAKNLNAAISTRQSITCAIMSPIKSAAFHHEKVDFAYLPAEHPRRPDW